MPARIFNVKNNIKEILANRPNGMSLKYIQQALLAAGWNPAESSKYINVYHTLRNNQHMFERIGFGIYKVNEQPALKPDDSYEDLIISVMSNRASRACEIWRKLQIKNIFNSLEKKAIIKHVPSSKKISRYWLRTA